MRFRNQSFIPAECPFNATDMPFDAGRAEFSLEIREVEGVALPPATSDVSEGAGYVEADGVFDGYAANSQEHSSAITGSVVAETDSPLGEALLELKGQLAEDSDAATGIQAALCERVDECHGVLQVDDGPPVCWALSAGGLQEALEQNLIHPE